MAKSKLLEEFKLVAVRQVVEREYIPSDVAKRPGVSVQRQVKVYSPNATNRY